MEPVDAADTEHPTVELASLTPEERLDLLGELVLRRAAEVLQNSDLDEEDNFLEHNLGSLAAVQLSQTLMADTGLEVPIVAIVEHPTATLLAKYLAEEYEQESIV